MFFTYIHWFSTIFKDVDYWWSELITTLIINHFQIIYIGCDVIPRTKGSKNKKTLLKEKSSPIVTPSVKPELIVELKPVIISNEPVTLIVVDDPDKIKLAPRIFNLEKHVHESFMNKLSKDCSDKDVKICESYVINELMKMYLARNIKLDSQPADVVYNYMQNFSLLSEEPLPDVKESVEMSEFKLANRRMSKFNNDLVQHKYKVYIDPDAKLFMMSFPINPSFAMNELLKIYNRNEVELHTDPMFLERFRRRYKYVSSKKVDTNDDGDD